MNELNKQLKPDIKAVNSAEGTFFFHPDQFVSYLAEVKEQEIASLL